MRSGCELPWYGCGLEVAIAIPVMPGSCSEGLLAWGGGVIALLRWRRARFLRCDRELAVRTRLFLEKDYAARVREKLLGLRERSRRSWWCIGVEGAV